VAALAISARANLHVGRPKNQIVMVLMVQSADMTKRAASGAYGSFLRLRWKGLGSEFRIGFSWLAVFATLDVTGRRENGAGAGVLAWQAFYPDGGARRSLPPANAEHALRAGNRGNNETLCGKGAAIFSCPFRANPCD